MKRISDYINKNLLLLIIGAFFLGGFLYLTYTGNQLCDCATTEKYRDGATRYRSHGTSFYRFYHK